MGGTAVDTSTVWELNAWGRRYESIDGGLREVRFVRLGEVGSRTEDSAEVAIAAYVDAFGTPAPWPRPWADPFQPAGRSGVDRVGVIEVGLANGSRVQRFAGTAGAAERYFADNARQQIGTFSTIGDAVPGSGCTNCKRLARIFHRVGEFGCANVGVARWV